MADPWSNLQPPAASGDVRALRVATESPFDFFWARDIHGRVLLILEFPGDIEVSGKNPRLKGVGLLVQVDPNSDRKRQILELKESEHRELFHTLCNDILSACRNCRDIACAVQVMRQRTWRWHQLLKGGSSVRLGLSAQKGLIGELIFLRDILLENYSPSEAVSFWKGPDPEPKDFNIGSIAVEIKAMSSTGRAHIEISSESQLDTASLSNLFLYVISLATPSGKDPGAFSLDSLVVGLRNLIRMADPAVEDIFDVKLAEYGWHEEDNYSDPFWLQTGSDVYHVKAEFPCITPELVPPGVLTVSYKVDLARCRGYLVDETYLINVLKG